MHTRFTAGFSGLLIALLLLAPCAQATTRLVLTLDELVTQSQLIFIGSVEAVELFDDAGVVYTQVRFNIEWIVSGDPSITTLDLRFLGGATATAHTEIVGQFIPTQGMRGLWFVDDAGEDLINPLTGWSQGYFPLVATTDGSEWLNLQDHPDYGILEPRNALAGKMRSFNFPAPEISTRFPQALRYPLDDFIAVVAAIAAERGR